MPETLNDLRATVLETGVPILYKLVGALLLWIVGRWVISVIVRSVKAGLGRRSVDPTVARYGESAARVLLTLLLAVALLGVLGVETTSFAAMFAAVGLAIGSAWGGLLANFAAGIFLVVLRPFKVGEMICAGGVTGVVAEIGLFATTIDGADNVRVFVGNNKIFSDNVVNYTTNPHRRVELRMQLAGAADVRATIAALEQRMAKIPNVMKDPAPSAAIVDFTERGPVLCVRPHCHNDHYWDVYFAAQHVIAEVGATQPAPALRVTVVQAS